MGLAVVLLATSGANYDPILSPETSALIGLIAVWAAAVILVGLAAFGSVIDRTFWFPFGLAAAALPAIAVVLTLWIASARDEALDRHEALPRLEVASNPDAPAEALAILAGDPYSDVRLEVASNPAAPAEAFAVLAEDSDKEIRLLVASNPDVPPEALAALAQDQDDEVRVAVAVNPSTPSAVLVSLAGGRSPAVRACVGANPNASPETLIDLAVDDDPDVRLAAVSRPHPPEQALIAASSVGVGAGEPPATSTTLPASTRRPARGHHRN